MSVAPVLLDGQWRTGRQIRIHTSVSPLTGEELFRYPRSTWSELDTALQAGTRAFEGLMDAGPERWGSFLEILAQRVEGAAPRLAETAHQETGLPLDSRFLEIEIPRTVNQLEQAGAASRSRSWRRAVVNMSENVARYRIPVPGVVVVMGPNNFPFAFNAVGGGDFAAAIGTGHPVLAKANPGHPGTTLQLAELAFDSLAEVGLPLATLQLLYEVEPRDGRILVADPRVAATAFTGSRRAGVSLKEAADAVGRPIYLEMSASNPVVILPRAIDTRLDQIASELASSVMLGSGQFCTKPGLVFCPEDAVAGFLDSLGREMDREPAHSLLGEKVSTDLAASIQALTTAGASTAFRSERIPAGCGFPGTILHADAALFLDRADELQQEAFGNATMVIGWDRLELLVECIHQLRGTLTATIYFTDTELDTYRKIERALSGKAGRLVANKPPTGVKVVSAMNHGGPFPSTGHPGFTSVGIPESFNRFTMLQTFDNVPDSLLPPELQGDNPLGINRDDQ